MRFSWIDADLLRATQEVFVAEPESEEDFTSGFELPPAPEGVSEADWPRVVEHVARTDRVLRLIAQEGLARARHAFADSTQAAEIAALAAAALEADELEIDLIEALLDCPVDEHVAYGAVLAELVAIGARENQWRVVDLYATFCSKAAEKTPLTDSWLDRVDAMRGGLAGAYVSCDRCDDAHRIFETQHSELTDNVYIALSASRTFLAAGKVRRAADWLEIGAERALSLGRTAMETKLREKSAALRKRLD